MDDLEVMIGKILLEQRKKVNKTQQEVVDELPGMTTQMLSSYEKNYKKPGIENLIKLAKYYNISLDYLCTGKEHTISNQKKIDNYEELIRVLFKIRDTGLFNLEASYNDIGEIINGIENGKYVGSITLESEDLIISKFFDAYNKLESVKDSLGEEVFNSSVEGLIKNSLSDILIK